MRKWMQALLSLVKGQKATCPHCGGSNLDYGYVMLNEKRKSGYGAVWCNDCHKAFPLSRAVDLDKADQTKILPDLPKDIVFT